MTAPKSDEADLAYGILQPDYGSAWQMEPALVAALAAALSNPHARRILELGVGTGGYLLELATRSFRLIGLERSAELLERGRAKVREHWIHADALALPLRDRSIDSAVGFYSLENAAGLEATLCELRRVVRNGVVLKTVVRENVETLWYRHYFPEIDQILRSLYPPLGTAIVSMLRAGFKRVVTRPQFNQGGCSLTLESARERPRLLFDASYRKATEIFTRIGDQALESGLRALECDLGSGALAEIRARYESGYASAGDFVILCATAF